MKPRTDQKMDRFIAMNDNGWRLGGVPEIYAGHARSSISAADGHPRGLDMADV